jgi:carbon storage regulator CsrA
MLVLTRKSHETIQIGPNIVITILRVKGNAVRVGIEAPRNVNVLRGELEHRPGSNVMEPVEILEGEAALPVNLLRRDKAATLPSSSGKNNVPTRSRGTNPLGSRMTRGSVAPLMNYLARL